MGSVAKGNANKYTVDAKDLQFQVSTRNTDLHRLYCCVCVFVCLSQIPDVILPMYEAQLREVHIYVVQ